MARLQELPSVVARLSGELDRLGIRHAVSGAAAMAAHGYVRATRDIDVLVIVPQLRLPEVFSAVRGLGFEGEDRDLILALRDRYVAELTSPALSVEILVPALPYHHRVVERAVVKTVAGQAVPFVSIEDLIVLKLLWLRAKDRADLQALVALGEDELDADYVRRTLHEMLPSDDERHAELERLLRQQDGPSG